MIDPKEKIQKIIQEGSVGDHTTLGYSPNQINELIENEFAMDEQPDQFKVIKSDLYGRTVTGFKNGLRGAFAQYGESMTDYSAGISQQGKMGLGGAKGLVIGFANVGDAVLAPLNEATGGSLDLLDQYVDSKPIQTYLREKIPEESLGTSGALAEGFATYVPGYIPAFSIASVYTKSIFLKGMVASVLAPWFYGESKNPNMATVVKMLTERDAAESKEITNAIVEWADTSEEPDTFDAKIKTVVADGPFEAGFVALFKAMGMTYRYFKTNPDAARTIAMAYNMMENDTLVEDALGNKYDSNKNLISLGGDVEQTQGEQ